VKRGKYETSLNTCFPAGGKDVGLTFLAHTDSLHLYLLFVWLRNLVSHVEGRTQIEGVCEQGTEEKDLREGGSDRKLEKIAH
jgi:hypothetical protein